MALEVDRLELFGPLGRIRQKQSQKNPFALLSQPTQSSTDAGAGNECRNWLFAGDERGTTAVEFGLVAAPFFAMLIAALQLGLVYLTQSALELATEKVARTVLTGSAQMSSLTQQQFLSSVCANLPSIMSCANLMVDAQVYGSFSTANTSSPTLTYSAKGSVSNTWGYNLGGANDIVVLRVMYLLPVAAAPLGFTIANTQFGNRLLMATAVFKNEPYQ